ncbi:unnamed protein product [Candida verbasci]|uniref:Ankyrin repeat-containing protein YCR051W n=1 Tax=Candida verbasci TaxID=1227364 RepID=A0A9W4XDA6_9ASCO|nr:unnamed protein product [Candida verbasci]
MVSNIWIAAADNNRSLVEEYINSGNFTPNSKDPNGYTPMHAASSYGHIELLKYLILKGGNINIQDNEGDSPLHYVEDLKVAKYLVNDLNADYRIKNNDGLNAQQYIEENDEFLDISYYLKTLSHENIDVKEGQNNDLLSSLPRPGKLDGHEIKYSLENENDLQGDEQLTKEELEERRKKIESILSSDDPEQGLRELVQNAVHEGITKYKEDQVDTDQKSSKRRKE